MALTIVHMPKTRPRSAFRPAPTPVTDPTGVLPPAFIARKEG